MAVGQFSPGPDMVLLTRVSLAHGMRAGLATAFGIACGLMIHAGVAVSGLAFVLGKNVMLYRGIKYLACGYLLWIAYQLLRSAAQKMRFKLEYKSADTIPVSLTGYWKMGFLCNILNPKVAVFLAGVTVPFLGMGGSAWAVLLWVTIFMEGWLLWSMWVRLLQVSMIKRWYQRFAYVVDGVFGVCLVALAALLAVK